jgi:hypothetical protein
MAKTQKKKPVPDLPSDRERAAFILSWLLRQADDRQVKILMKMTLRDWVDWIESKRLRGHRGKHGRL